MKILIATGIYPPDIGGPATYAKNLKEEWEKHGHQIKVVHFDLEKKLPTGLRHLYYFLRLLPKLKGVNFILILDTFSVGLPAILVAKIFRKKTILRTGGDFLWEQYVNNNKKDLSLPEFYSKHPQLNTKEKTIFFLTRFILRRVNLIVFSTTWQRNIFIREYRLDERKCQVIENFYPTKIKGQFGFVRKNFLWSGREIFLKNLDRLKKSAEMAGQNNAEIYFDFVSGVSKEELESKIQQSYAVILPSLSEISPNFILEAIKYDKPFILTRENGLMNRIQDFGVFINPLDTEDIKNKILFLTDGVNYRRTQEKVSHFNFQHSWEEIAKELLDLFRSI